MLIPDWRSARPKALIKCYSLGYRFNVPARTDSRVCSVTLPTTITTPPTLPPPPPPSAPPSTTTNANKIDTNKGSIATNEGSIATNAVNITALRQLVTHFSHKPYTLNPQP